MISRYVAQAKETNHQLQKTLKQSATLLEHLHQSIEDQMEERKNAVVNYKAMQDSHDATYSNAKTIFARTQEQTKALDAAIRQLEVQHHILSKNIYKTHNRYVLRVLDYALGGLIALGLYTVFFRLLPQFITRFSS